MRLCFVNYNKLNVLGEKKNKERFVEEKKLVDIGFPAHRMLRSEETRLKAEHRRKIKCNPEIEKKSRKLQCKLNQSQRNFSMFLIILYIFERLHNSKFGFGSSEAVMA